MHGKYRLLHDIPCCSLDFQLIVNENKSFVSILLYGQLYYINLKYHILLLPLILLE